MGKPYLVTGNKTSGYAVLTPDGAVKYDLLDTRSKASDIAAVLNDGIGPEWDAVERELDRRANAKASRKRKGGREQNPKSTSGRSITMTDPRELSAEEIKRLQGACRVYERTETFTFIVHKRGRPWEAHNRSYRRERGAAGECATLTSQL